HLDIKRPGLDKAVADLLTRMDVWDHVALCNDDNAGVILRDARLQRLRYKAPGLYADHADVFPDAVAAALKKPGDGVIVDDPRGGVAAGGPGVVEGSLRGPGGARPQTEPAQGLDVPRVRRRDGTPRLDSAARAQRRRDRPFRPVARRPCPGAGGGPALEEPAV